MLQYSFTESSTYIEYQRTALNLVDVLSEVGSLYNPFYAFGYICSLTFSYNLMMSSIMSSLYSFEAKYDSEVKKKKKKKAKGKGKGKSNAEEPEKEEDYNDLNINDEESGTDLNQ